MVGVSPRRQTTGIPSDTDESNGKTGGGADYDVPEIVAAREKFRVVSRWAELLEASRDDPDGRWLIKRDGERLAELWRDALAADDLAKRVALDELKARLEALR